MLHMIHLDDLAFPFWLTNQHAKLWWYKESLEFRAEHQFLKRCCNPGMVAMDIGAHHGIQTIPMALWAGETSRVYAFEANKDNAITLQANIALNNLSHCLGVYSAVGNQAGEIGMAGESVGEDFTPKVSAPCCTLDEFCSEHHIDSVDFIKIDVEGFERKVLEGAKRILNSLPHISLELHIDDLPSYGDTVQETLELIKWDAYDVRMMNRSVNWHQTQALSAQTELPEAGVVNLFFFNSTK